MVNVLDQVYMIRKRIKDKDLLKLKEIIIAEIERRNLGENNNASTKRT